MADLQDSIKEIEELRTEKSQLKLKLASLKANSVLLAKENAELKLKRADQKVEKSLLKSQIVQQAEEIEKWKHRCFVIQSHRPTEGSLMKRRDCQG